MDPRKDAAVSVIVKVFVASTQLLLGDALEQVLSRVDGLHVSRLIPETPQAIIEAINQHQPLILIVDEELVSEALCDKVTEMGGNGRLQFIVLSSKHNNVFICQFNHLMLAKVSDLLSPIKSFIKHP